MFQLPNSHHHLAHHSAVPALSSFLHGACATTACGSTLNRIGYSGIDWNMDCKEWVGGGTPSCKTTSLGLHASHKYVCSLAANYHFNALTTGVSVHLQQFFATPAALFYSSSSPPLSRPTPCPSRGGGGA